MKYWRSDVVGDITINSIISQVYRRIFANVESSSPLLGSTRANIHIQDIVVIESDICISEAFF